MFPLGIFKELDSIIKKVNTIDLNNIIDDNQNNQDDDKINNIIIIKLPDNGNEKYIYEKDKNKENNKDIENDKKDDKQQISLQKKEIPQFGSKLEQKQKEKTINKYKSAKEVEDKIKDFFDQFALVTKNK